MLHGAEHVQTTTTTTTDDPFSDVSDPYDFPDAKTSVVVKCKGIVVRTDFTNDDAWSAVRSAIEAAERDGWKALSDDVAAADDDDADESSGSEDNEDGDEDMEVDAETAANTSANAQPASDADTRALIFLTDERFDALSNLGALRLLNDVRVARALQRPLSHVGKVPAPHRLVARDGLREVYVGPQLWIYDAQSNTDRTLRLVERAGAMYGTATCVTRPSRAAAG